MPHGHSMHMLPLVKSTLHTPNTYVHIINLLSLKLKSKAGPWMQGWYPHASFKRLVRFVFVKLSSCSEVSISIVCHKEVGLSRSGRVPVMAKVYVFKSLAKQKKPVLLKDSCRSCKIRPDECGKHNRAWTAGKGATETVGNADKNVKLSATDPVLQVRQL